MKQDTQSVRKRPIWWRRFSWPVAAATPKMGRVPLTPEQINQVAAVLNTRGAANRCDVCRHTGTMALVPETAQVPMSFAPNVFGGSAIPCAVTVCNNCGNIRLHALGPLGLQALGNRTGP